MTFAFQSLKKNLEIIKTFSKLFTKIENDFVGTRNAVKVCGYSIVCIQSFFVDLWQRRTLPTKTIQNWQLDH